MAQPSTVSRRLAGRHEAVYGRVAALTHQIEVVAGRRPGWVVPPPVRALAEQALYDCRVFGRRRRGHALPVVAEHYGPLAAQLGTALAVLSAFEAAHSGWNGALKAYLWQVEGQPLPIRRLRPQLDMATYAKQRDDNNGLRDKLAKRITAITRGLDAAKPLARTYPPRPTPAVPAPPQPRLRSAYPL